MKYDLFDEIRDAFSGLSEEQEQDEGSYKILTNWIGGEIGKFGGKIATTLGKTSENIQLNIHACFEDGRGNILPAVDREALERLRRRFSADPDLADVAGVVAGMLYETRLAQDTPRSLKSDVSNVLLETELASYVSWINKASSASDEYREVEITLRQFRSEADSVFGSLKDRVQEASNVLIDLQQKQLEITHAVEDGRASLQTLQDNAGTYIGDVSSQYAKLDDGVKKAVAKLNAAEETIATNSARALWSSRAIRSAWAFWLSAMLLAVLLLGAPVLVIWQLEWTLQTLRHISEASMQGLPQDPSATQLAVASLGRVVVIALPIALFVWLIRLIVRFNFRSLMLLDDAQQRQTMMDTYFHLIEKQAAVKEDRALMLTALFRPAAGHGADNIGPPSFTDLMEKIPK